DGPSSSAPGRADGAAGDRARDRLRPTNGRSADHVAMPSQPANGQPGRVEANGNGHDHAGAQPLGQLATIVAVPNIPLEVVFSDDQIVVINKQPGLVVHQGVGHQGDTLVDA